MFAVCCLVIFAPVADPAPVSVKDALKPFNPFVGTWKGTGYPEGTKAERDAGFWSESVTWAWQFKGQDAWLTATFEKGKHFAKAELRYDPAAKDFTFTVTGVDKMEKMYRGLLTVGKQKEQVLTLARADDAAGTVEQVVFTLLHHNRHLYRFETRPTGVKTFARRYQVGCTKEGESFADVPKGPECIVSGGLAKTPVSHKGVTYYVCCTGCRDAFKDDPEKYVKEYEAKQKEKKK